MSRLQTDHVQAVAQAFAVNQDEISKLGGFENVIYKCEQGEQSCILRFSHSSRRQIEDIQGELDWLLHLQKHDLQVCAPILSSDGQGVIALDDGCGEHFLVSLFERAPGRHMSGQDHEWNEELFAEWGKVTASFHLASRSYETPAHLTKRTNDETATDPAYLQTLSPAEQQLESAFMKAFRLIENFPKHTSTYGMCHRDLHQGNFMVHNGRIFAFDFDDCRYDHYAQDVAMAVYYASIFADWRSPISDPTVATQRAHRFFTAFLNGYEQVTHAERHMLRQVPAFIEKRRSDLAMILYPIWGEQGTYDQKLWLEASVAQTRDGIACLSLDGLLP